MTNINLRSQKGMTIIEVLVAVVILAITTTGVVQLITVANQIKSRRSNALTATLLAANEAEEIKRLVQSLNDVKDEELFRTANGMEYRIVRTTLVPPQETECPVARCEVNVTMYRVSDNAVIGTYRISQGMQ